MAVDLSRYGIKVHRYLIHQGNTYEPIGDEVPQGAWLWRTIQGGTVELYLPGPPPQKVKPVEVLLLSAGCALICGAGLLLLPFLAILLGTLLPLAVIGLLVRHVVRLHRS
jgi:hypothetical protein